MDEHGMPITGAGVDYSTVEAINQRELVTYMNLFIVRTCAFLNTFSTKCEAKMARVHSRLDAVNTSLTLLENKLDSVEELKNVKLEATATTEITAAPAPQNTNGAPPPPPAPPAPGVVSQQEAASAPPPPPPPPEPAVNKVCDDPRYKKYFTMLKLGVHVEAIKIKMRTEGAIPDFIETPDAPAPPADEPEYASDSD